MSLYVVRHEDQVDYVEAESMVEAIRAWEDFQKHRTPGVELAEPGSCSLVHAAPVIRWSRKSQ